jgi:hypothetical protein
MRTLRFLAFWWLALAGWWVLVVGANAGLELVAGACAATLGTMLAVAVRRQELLRFRFEPAWLAKTASAPWKIAQELAVVTWALVLDLARVRRVRSAYRALPFPAGRADAVSAGRRAVVTIVSALSPNTLPLDMDCERGLVLRHELDPRHASDQLP